MQQMRNCFVVTLAVASLPVLLALGQDSQSLGDASRQARQQKQQKEAQAKDASKDLASKNAQPSKTGKIITNDEIPEHAGPAARPAVSETAYHDGSRTQPASSGPKVPAEAWKSQIQSQKNLLSSMQSEIDKLNDSIHFAPGNCVVNCVQWNERQKEKQEQVEQMKAQVEDQKKRLEDMQESARQQGYGSSVYDP